MNRPLRLRPVVAYTLLELLVSLAILGILAGLVVVNVWPLMAESRQSAAVHDIQAIEPQLQRYRSNHGHLPETLAEAMDPVPTDPWGNPYQYLRIEALDGSGQGNGNGGLNGKGKFRKDRFLVPVNSDFDLYSMGPDGKSQAPLTAAASRDDIIRASNGGFVGAAAAY